MRRARLTPRQLDRLRADLEAIKARRPARPLWPADAAEFFQAATGFPPDDWQRDVLDSKDSRLLLCCCRQAGKSTIVATLALRLALNSPRSLVLMLSPSERQSGELFTKSMGFFGALGEPIATPKRTERTVTFGNRSRIISLPGSSTTIRGYSGPALVVLDEAAYVADDLLTAVSPMLAISGGRLIGLSTPCGKRGWFSDRWHDGSADWRRIRVPAIDCPRIPTSFLEVERRSLGERWFRQEYMCSFEDAIGQFFSNEDIESAFTDELPLFGGSMSNHPTHDDVLTSDEPLFEEMNNGNGRARHF